MRVLVTGATGFIGSHMAELATNKGWEVVCPMRNPAAPRNLAGIPARIIPLDWLESEVAQAPGFDYVIHVAGATRALNYRAYIKANVEFTRHLLELIDQSPTKSALKRFVLVSSQAASGPSPEGGGCCAECDPPSPISNYGLSKLEAEQTALSYNDKLPITIVRPPTVFGPRDTDVLGVFKWAVHGLAPCVAGPDRLVSIIYVEDLVHGILAAALSDIARGEIYFLANPEAVIWSHFTLQVAHVMGFSAVSLPVPVTALKLMGLAGDLAGRIRGAATLIRSEKVVEMNQLAWVCSTEKAYKDLNWRPEIPLDEAIRRTAKWYMEHKWI
ncbi:MAG: NAD(P)-dependent oxidoreductase [Deltaproteobacteria bacterium]|nr:NAD(P)-dependent oxidoreductase [Deltaproteobacteria bacterium]